MSWRRGIGIGEMWVPARELVVSMASGWPKSVEWLYASGHDRAEWAGTGSGIVMRRGGRYRRCVTGSISFVGSPFATGAA